MSSRPISILGIVSFILVSVPITSRAVIHNISMSGTSFSPKNTVVNYGDTVRWTNNSGVHTTTSDASSPKSWSSGTVSLGAHFDQVFTAANGTGPFPYHCEFHVTLNMVDTIRVNPPPCCIGQRGNVNCTGIVDPADLAALVSYLNGGGLVLCCPNAANVNGTGIVDAADLATLISYLGNSGLVLPNCP